MPRTNRGRQRIEMMKISKESNLLVTFSKRRSGLFKKASELCTLCGVEIAIIVFSPGKKVFSFGHPSVEKLVDRFHSITGNNPNPNPNPNPNSGADELFEAHRNLNVCGLNMQLTNLLNQFELEKNRSNELSKIRIESGERGWWEGPIEALDVHQIEKVKVALEGLKKNVIRQSEKMWLEGLGASRPPYFMGDGPGGGQGINVFPPLVSQRGQNFPPHVPPQDLNASEFGLSSTPHGYSMGYNCASHFG